MRQQPFDGSLRGGAAGIRLKVAYDSVRKGDDGLGAIDSTVPERRLPFCPEGFGPLPVSSSRAFEYALSADGSADVERGGAGAIDDAEWHGRLSTSRPMSAGVKVRSPGSPVNRPRPCSVTSFEIVLCSL